jgi:hypothetical protein
VKAITPFSLAALAGSASLALVLSACASDQAVIQDQPDASGTGNRDSGGSDGNGSQADSAQPPPLTCSSPCQTDIECQNRCPQLDAGVYCCDLSNLCYPSASATCQSSNPDGGNLPD